MELKEKILTQSETMFLRYGIKSVTMDDIARDLGISKKTLYQYVDNKADLLEQVVRMHVQAEELAIKMICESSKNAIDEMLQIARYVTEVLRTMPATTMYDLQKYYRNIWQLMESLHQGYIYDVIKRNLDNGIQEGLYRAELNADIIAKLYVGKTNCVIDEDMFPLKEYNKENLFKEYFYYHIHGIASAKGLKLLEQYLT